MFRSRLLLGLVLFGCRGEHEQAMRAEAARVLRAVELLRDAPNAEKADRLARLRGEACSDPTVCELKTACVQAYTLHVQGLERARVARAALDPDAGTERLDQVGQLTEQAGRDLARARPATERCATLSGELRRSIGR